MILSDSRVLACVALGHGMNHLSVLLIPSAGGERWLAKAPRAHVLLWLEQICAQAPSYAVPKDFIVCPPAQAKRLGLLASSGRIARGTAATAYPALKLASRRAAAWPNPHRMEEKHRAVL
jgi:hypothetical protein